MTNKRKLSKNTDDNIKPKKKLAAISSNKLVDKSSKGLEKSLKKHSHSNSADLSANMTIKRKMPRTKDDDVKPMKKLLVSSNELIDKSLKSLEKMSKQHNKSALTNINTDPMKMKQESKRIFKRKTGTKRFDSKDATKPPNWSEFKKKKKQLRISRKHSKVEGSFAEVVVKAKQLSEKLRRKKNAPEERENLVQQLHSVLKEGSYIRLALAHDTSRIIQWLLKFATPIIRNDITSELIPIVSQMMQSKYARNCVKKMLKYSSPDYHGKIIESFYGNVVNLASHSFSSPIIDVAYSNYANEKQRWFLQQEFYGDIYKKTKDEKVHELSDTYTNSPGMKNAILTATKGNLERILNKNVHDNALMHAVLYNYLSVCSPDERNEMLSSLSGHVAPLSNSKYGVKVAVMCVQHGTNKDKKAIMKVIKEHAVSLGTHEHGHLLLLAIFSSVDDTVLVKKALLSVFLEKVKDVAKEEWGRKTLLWLVAPGDKKHFHPSFLNWLQEGISTGTSKKDPAIRSAELLEATLPVLCNSLTEDPQFWVANGSIGLLTVAILKAAKGDALKNALGSLCKFLCKPDWLIKEGEEEVHGIEHPAIHACLKKLAQDDKHRSQNGDKTFGEELCDVIAEDSISHWLNFNRGCFILVFVFENNQQSVQVALSTLLEHHKKSLKKKTFAGAKILLKKLTEVNGSEEIKTPAKRNK